MNRFAALVLLFCLVGVARADFVEPTPPPEPPPPEIFPDLLVCRPLGKHKPVETGELHEPPAWTLALVGGVGVAVWCCWPHKRKGPLDDEDDISEDEDDLFDDVPGWSYDELR